MSKYEGSVEKRIYDAAKMLFAEKGHEETRLREIAAAAHTSESQVVKYYESKAGLLEAIIGEVRSKINNAFKQAQKDENDPVLILDRLQSLLFDLYYKEPELFKVYLFSTRYFTLIPEEQLLPESQFRAQIGAIIKRGQKAKVFRNDIKSHAAASALWGAILGLMRDKLYSARTKDFPELSRKEMTVVLNALVASFVKKETTSVTVLEKQ